ncbi:FAD-dependent oxidoreductase [Clostridium novyi A str. 4552]|uniref:FAD-dependent oxidoreductase n=1 Tax=Clostridium novyi A str. 4552 TaxID=1444289 RepID=A0A0A0I2J3_CLONO|nr:FAD-dependent oxidoreductase [Clostridium novyi]KGM94853.1 FAD-dependent oxidoreductase [Clostridium novyi A str. 4552]
MKIVIIGGGWSGCAAAITAKKAGADVALYEKTDMLLGLGNVGGIMRNNGRYTASEELIALGAGDLINITDKNTRHKNINFPGHEHAWLYDVNLIEAEVRNYLIDIGIDIHLISRVVNVEKEGNKIKGVYLSDGTYVEGDAFIETTGTTGPMGNCLRYGNGCSMCILRCPAFGPRISISKRAGIEDLKGERADEVYGAFSGSCKLCKESIDPKIVKELEEKGIVILKVPKEDVNFDKLKVKVCQQYALKEFAENVILLDTGHVKLMTCFYPLQKLRKIKGLEHVKYVDPYAGGKGNSVRYLAITPRDNAMKVIGLDNLFCGGEKSGLFVGHTEAISTGSLAGANAVRHAADKNMIVLPNETVIGDIIDFANKKFLKDKDKKSRFTFAGSIYFNRMKEIGLYSTDSKQIEDRITKLGLKGIFNEKIL